MLRRVRAWFRKDMVSSFFREGHHFATLREAAPHLCSRAKSGEKIRIWSAGCSSGQEPYSIGMTLLEAEPSIGQHDLRILATDIDPVILAHARSARYGSLQMSGISEDFRARYFEATGGDTFVVKEAVRSLVSFRELNLLRDWPMQGSFDVVFCRNVVIYFDEETQLGLWPRFRRILADEGLMFLGHSERIPDAATMGFLPDGITTYRAVRG